MESRAPYGHPRRRFSVRGMIACTALFVWAFAPSLHAAELIQSFNADIEVRKDATFTVTERITYTFDAPRHGIYRCIPLTHPDKASSFFKERYIEIALGQVTKGGESVPYSLEESRTETCIKIGDPNATIEGAHEYEIVYTVEGGISYLDFGGAELYWNVTGNEWEVPMESVEATVSSPDSILTRERACYRGRFGEANSCEVSTQEDGSVRFGGRLFAPGEGMTVAQALNRTIVVEDVRERYNPILLWFVGGLLLLLGVGISIYRYKTKFRTGRTIIPQYEPYPGVKPMYAGFLFDKRLDPRDMTAGIVYLAKEGYLKIRKVDAKVLFFFEVDDYEIELTRSPETLADSFERTLLGLIFTDGGTTVGSKMSLRELKNNHSQARENWKLLQDLKSRLRKDLREQGYFMGFDFMTLFSTRFIVSLLIIAGAFWLLSSGLLIALVVGLIVLFFAFLEGRRTTKGYEALDHLKGFRDFLSVTEKERYIFHNAPERNADQFMEYLPYAIAFGVEEKWAKTFEGITIPNPEWYDGGVSGGSFNAVNLTHSLGAFSTAFSTSSGTSASSGGGSSGGGGGGGGGGSW